MTPSAELIIAGETFAVLTMTPGRLGEIHVTLDRSPKIDPRRRDAVLMLHWGLNREPVRLLCLPDVPFKGTLAEFVADHRRYLQSRSGFHEIGQEPFVTASGIHGVVIRCTVKDTEVPVRTNFDCYYFERSPSLKFLLMAYSAADAREQIQPLFDDAVRTFHFTETN
jgi:hypothetical protein